MHRCMFLTTTNGQQKSIAATNNRTVPLITDAFLLCVTKIHEGLDGGGGGGWSGIHYSLKI